MNAAFQLWVGAILISFAAIFVKLVDHMGPTMIGFYRCLMATMILIPFLLAQPAKETTKNKIFSQKKFWLLVFAVGFFFALDLFFWNRSIIYAGAGMATILANTQVFYLALIGAFFFKEKISLKLISAITMAFLGIYLLTNPTHSLDISTHYWEGVCYGLLTGVVYSCYLVTLRLLKSLGIELTTTLKLTLVSASTASFLFIFACFDEGITLPQEQDWIWLFALALVAQVGGWLIITHNLPKITVSKVGLILLTQPVGATLWGVIIFKESMSVMQVVGGVITLAAIYLATTRNA